MTQPTGVFVRLPLSEDDCTLLIDASSFGAPDDSHDKALLAIGTPVTGGELEVVGYADAADLPLPDGGPTNWTADINAKPDEHTTEALVRQSDALAKLAAKDAEILRLRKALDALENSNNNLCFMRSKDTYQSMLRDGCQDLLADLDRARLSAREALKGPEA